MRSLYLSILLLVGLVVTSLAFTPIDANALLTKMEQARMQQDDSTRAALVELYRNADFYVRKGDWKAAKIIVENFTNPQGSTLTADQFSAFKTQFLSWFPSN